MGPRSSSAGGTPPGPQRGTVKSALSASAFSLPQPRAALQAAWREKDSAGRSAVPLTTGVHEVRADPDVRKAAGIQNGSVGAGDESLPGVAPAPRGRRPCDRGPSRERTSVRQQAAGRLLGLLRLLAGRSRRAPGGAHDALAGGADFSESLPRAPADRQAEPVLPSQPAARWGRACDRGPGKRPSGRRRGPPRTRARRRA